MGVPSEVAGASGTGTVRLRIADALFHRQSYEGFVASVPDAHSSFAVSTALRNRTPLALLLA
jgi:hypothetical protein